MDLEDLYDEFGNYVGPDQSDSDSDSLQLPELKSSSAADADLPQTGPNTAIGSVQDTTAAEEQQNTKAIILAEDKQYYPSAEDVFGPDTEVLVEEEDSQPITQPIVEPRVELSSGFFEKEDSVPPPKYSRAFLVNAILPNPDLNRNIALVGHLHHGKTSFADMLFDFSHEMPWQKLDDRELPVRYMDTRYDEQDLRISIKTTSATFLLQTSMEKSYGITILDTPGHINFLDEVIAAMNLVDGVVVLVDVAEGIMMGTDVILRKAAELQLDIVLVISKLDRLCLELRLPPAEAYDKIRHIIDGVNDVITPYGLPVLSPAKGNVAFSSATERICFTLPQFSETYIQMNGGSEKFPMSKKQLARRLWGDVYYDKSTRKFTREDMGGFGIRTFVSFVLEPFYKLHTAILSEDVEDLADFLSRNDLLRKSRRHRLGPTLGNVDRQVLTDDVKAVLKNINRSTFGMGEMTGFVEMLVSHIQSPVDAAKRKIEVMGGARLRALEYFDSEWTSALMSCDGSQSAPLTGYVGKLIANEKGTQYDCLFRVFSGRVCPGDNVCVLGNSYDRKTNAEDQTTVAVEKVFIPCGRFKIEVDDAVAGQLVLISGVDDAVFKSATIVSDSHAACQEALALRPLQEYLPTPVVKVAVEPVRPSDLPKMISCLRKCVNSYPGLVTKVEETGEHTLIGSGELYMDCVLRDLRELQGKIEVKVSDPVVPFAETVSETSALKCYADTPNGQNKIEMVAEPLDETVLKALDDGSMVSNGNDPKDLRDYGWDALAAKSLWTFGPDTSRGPNALLNDVLIQDTRKNVEEVRDSIVQGFAWATREGPLSDEPVRGVKLRLLDANIAMNESGRSPAQIIPTCRRVAYSSILTACPRLMEPMYLSEIICPTESLNVVYMLVSRRRGVVISEVDVAGTPLKRVVIHMPVLDSFGFEPDLRNLTHGSAFCLQMFDHWSVVPGDPLDRNVELRPLEPAGRRELARECMVKTRRRKGMPDDVSITKYFDDPLLLELAKDNEEIRQLL